MNRITHLIHDLEALLQNDGGERHAIERLRVAREPFLRLVRDLLAELNVRRQIAGESRHIRAEIVLWENVLEWLKQQQGRYIDLSLPEE